MNVSVFTACLVSFFVTNAVADPIYVAEFADGSAKFYAYPDTFTVYSDGYGALVEKRVNGKAQTRIYYSISKESCAARGGNLLSREHSMDKWTEDSKAASACQSE